MEQKPKLFLLAVVLSALAAGQTNSKMNSKKIQEKLIEKKILIRDCSNFRGLGNKFIRVAVRTRKENVKLVRALGDI